jgi:hypothetical protein
MNLFPKSRTFAAGTAGVFLAAGVTGWFLVPAPTPSARGNPDAPGLPARPHRAAPGGRTANARRQLEAIHRADSRQERMRKAIALALSLSPSQIKQWMEGGVFDCRDGFELMVFRRVVEERWRNEDPEGFVAWCFGRSESNGRNAAPSTSSAPRDTAFSILEDWALNDPARLDAYFEKHPSLPLQGHLLSRLAKQNPTVAAGLLRKFVTEDFSDTAWEYLQSPIFELAANAPDALEGILDSLPPVPRKAIESAVVRQRLSTSFHSEIRSLFGRPDGWNLFWGHFPSKSSSKLLKELPNLPATWINAIGRLWPSYDGLFSTASDAEAWFQTDLENAGFARSQARSMRAAALRSIAEKKPERALDLLPEVDLTKEERKNLIRQIFKRLAADPENAGQAFARLDNESDRQIAQALLDARPRQHPPNQNQPASDWWKIKTPEEWLSRIAEGEIERKGSLNPAYTLRTWDRRKIAELAERFAQLPAGRKEKVVRVFTDFGYHNHVDPVFSGAVVRELLDEQAAQGAGAPGAAIERASKMASTTATHWAVRNPREALAWVETLPEGQAKTWARRNAAATWADFDPAPARQWIDSLDAATRKDVENYLEKRKQE